MAGLGRHIIVDFFECKADLNDPEGIRKAIYEAAKACKSTVIERSHFHFTPYGVTCVVLIAESHLSIHTWPEYGYAAVDLFTCGSHVDPNKAFNYLKKKLQPKRMEKKQMVRGVLKKSDKAFLKRFHENLKKQKRS